MTKEETKKLTRETRRDIVNIVMVVISCILYCLLIYGMVLMFRQFSTMVSSMNDYISCVDDAADVSDASAFLTDQVHHYVVEREPGHLEAYFVEANETKRRESALENLEEFADKETISSMQAGLVYGQIGQTEYIVRHMIAESGYENVKVVATGGLGRIIANETDCIDIYDPNLTLSGLQLIFEKQK